MSLPLPPFVQPGASERVYRVPYQERAAQARAWAAAHRLRPAAQDERRTALLLVGALGSPIYQLFPGGERGPAGTIFPPRKRPTDQVSVGQCSNIKRVAAGPVYDRWEFSYQVPGATQYVLVATFFHQLPQFELTARLVKTDVRDPEGMFVLFPFAVPDGVWHWDKPGALIRPGIDQLPQSCTDYYLLQHGAALAGKKGVQFIATREAIRAVPPQIREAAYALGATKWQTVRDHVVPYSMGGILTGIILALSRAVGETAPLICLENTAGPGTVLASS